MILYHTGFSEIRFPDIRHGRKNADFGQGFYLSADPAFSRRWAGSRRGQDTYINTYELRTERLTVKTFARDREWFEYISANRNGKEDALSGCDVIVGPIANDTIYDLFGITTSGFLTAEEALKLLSAGPEYTQVTLKTDRAAEALRFLSSEIISREEIEGFRDAVKREEEAYQEQAARLMRENDP